jgi:prefoldin subunit 5
MAMQDLAQIKAGALAILGKTAKFPDPKSNINKLITDYDAARKEYGTAVDALQSKILSLQNGASSVRNALKQYQDQLDSGSFGLNESEPGVKDKIAKADKYIDNALNEYIRAYDTAIKNLEELTKHSMALNKYKSP